MRISASVAGIALGLAVMILSMARATAIATPQQMKTITRDFLILPAVTLSTCYGYGHQYFTVIHGALDKTFQIPATKTAK